MYRMRALPSSLIWSNGSAFPVFLSLKLLEARVKVDRDRVEGAAKNLGGKVKEAAGLNLVGFLDILLTRDFDAGLDLPDGHSRKMQSLIRSILNPSHHALMWLGFTQLGNHVRVQQVHG